MRCVRVGGREEGSRSRSWNLERRDGGREESYSVVVIRGGKG